MATTTIRDYTILYISGDMFAYVEVTDSKKSQSSFANLPTLSEVQTAFGTQNITELSLDSCFEGCTSLVTAPTIPSSGIVNINGCFSGCTSLVNAPTIPSGIGSGQMVYCFEDCTSLVTAPTIPNDIYSLDNCFSGCTSLVNAPIIPDSVTTMKHCFEGCTSLVKAPTISSNVIGFDSCFEGCISLKGNITVNATKRTFTSTTDCFKDTIKPIGLLGESQTLLQQLVDSANNGNVVIGKVTSATIRCKVNGAWKEGEPKVKVNGAWKDVDAIFVKVGGAWKDV